MKKLSLSLLLLLSILCSNAQWPPTDPAFYQQGQLFLHGFDLIGFTNRGASLVVGGIDTGVNLYPDLEGRIYPGMNFYDNKRDTRDSWGHGTGTTSLAVSNANNGWGGVGALCEARVAPMACYPVLQTTGVSGLKVQEAIADAIKWAGRKRIKALWLDFGFDGWIPTVVGNAIRRYNGVVCLAAGNGNYLGYFAPLWQENPYPNVCIVSGWNWQESNRGPAGDFGPAIDLVASFQNFFSAEVGPNWLSIGLGTSGSAPLVACAAALVYQQHPTWTPAQVIAHLKATATDVWEPGFDERTGAGLLNAWAAVGGGFTFLRPQPRPTGLILQYNMVLPSGH